MQELELEAKLRVLREERLAKEREEKNKKAAEAVPEEVRKIIIQPYKEQLELAVEKYEVRSQPYPTKSLILRNLLSIWNSFPFRILIQFQILFPILIVVAQDQEDERRQDGESPC